METMGKLAVVCLVLAVCLSGAQADDVVVNETVCEGEDLSLPCNYTGNVTEIVWSVNGTANTAMNGFRDYNITMVEPGDAGRYTCSVNGTVNAMYDVDVLYASGNVSSCSSTTIAALTSTSGVTPTSNSTNAPANDSTSGTTGAPATDSTTAPSDASATNLTTAPSDAPATDLTTAPSDAPATDSTSAPSDAPATDSTPAPTDPADNTTTPVATAGPPSEPSNLAAIIGGAAAGGAAFLILIVVVIIIIVVCCRSKKGGDIEDGGKVAHRPKTKPKKDGSKKHRSTILSLRHKMPLFSAPYGDSDDEDKDAASVNGIDNANVDSMIMEYRPKSKIASQIRVDLEADDEGAGTIENGFVPTLGGKLAIDNDESVAGFTEGRLGIMGQGTFGATDAKKDDEEENPNIHEDYAKTFKANKPGDVQFDNMTYGTVVDDDVQGKQTDDDAAGTTTTTDDTHPTPDTTQDNVGPTAESVVVNGDARDASGGVVERESAMYSEIDTPIPPPPPPPPLPEA